MVVSSNLPHPQWNGLSAIVSSVMTSECPAHFRCKGVYLPLWILGPNSYTCHYIVIPALYYREAQLGFSIP